MLSSNNLIGFGVQESAPPVPPPYVPPNPYTIDLIRNDLDFIYSSEIDVPPSAGICRLEFTIDTTNFFSNGGDHIPFGVNMGWPNTLHCGPIVRNGRDIFGIGRGALIASGVNVVYAEHWNNTGNPGLQLLNSPGLTLNTAIHTHLYVVLDCTFTDGGTTTYDLRVRVYNVDGGALLFDGYIPGTGSEYDFPRPLKSIAMIGGIANGFVSPNSTGCVEKLGSGIAPNAKAIVTNISHIAF